jgi:hypothetical protein
MPKQSIVLTFIISVWLIACASGFWWFEYQYWGAYDKQLIQFESQPIRNLYPILKKVAPNKPFIVHFKDDECPCERYRKVHIATIKPMLEKAQQVTLNRNDSVLLGVMIPAFPAVAIWNQQGELAYFGPYSSGMTCGEGFDFIKMVLDKLAKNDNPQWVNNQGFGCFCP